MPATRWNLLDISNEHYNIEGFASAFKNCLATIIKTALK